MAQNTSPIWTLVPRIQNGTLTGNIGSARSDGVGTIGTDLFIVFQADATDGSYLKKVRINAAATTPTTMTASVIRLFFSSATSGVTTAANCWLHHEITTAAIPAANATNATNYYEVPMDIVMPASYTLLASIHANMAANTRFHITAFGGDY